MKLRALAFSLACGLPLAAQAASWHADAKNSALAFSGTYQGDAFDGRFKTFDANIAFDPAQLANSRFDVKITLASADTANSERDETLRGADFFDTAHMPVATYTAAKFRSLGGGRYAADGTLALRGVSKPVTLTFTWNVSRYSFGVGDAIAIGETHTLVGDALVNRLDFGVGGGEWADTATIGNAVKVHTVLKLAPAAASTWKPGQPREPKPVVRKGG